MLQGRTHVPPPPPARRLAAWTLAAALVAGALDAGAQATADPPAAMELPPGVTALAPLARPQSERFRFDSRNVGKAFVIDVTLVESPQAAATPDGLPPVIFFTDNDGLASVVPELVSRLALAPSVVVVGIGYNESLAVQGPAQLVELSLRRNTDFTQVHDDAAYAALMAGFERARLPLPPPTRFGGADDFLAFIDDELKPFIAARYTVSTDDATLLGHSLGGYFALHVLFTSPQSFHRYVVLSPPVQYADYRLFEEEDALGDVPARLFIGLGDNDMAAVMASAPRLDAELRATARPSLGYRYQRLPQADHMAVTRPGFEAGLRFVFGSD